jgi:hypothetical protein
MPPCSAFFCWDRVLGTFCLSWPGTGILPISASQVRITSERHQHLANFLLWEVKETLWLIFSTLSQAYTGNQTALNFFSLNLSTEFSIC